MRRLWLSKIGCKDEFFNSLIQFLYGEELLRLSISLRQSHLLDESLAMLEACVATRERLVGTEHPEYAIALTALAQALQRSERPEGVARALDILERFYAARVRTLGKEHEDTSNAGFALGKVLGRIGRPAEAEIHFRERRTFLEAPLRQ
jgi:uncharacterized membrane protein YccC